MDPLVRYYRPFLNCTIEELRWSKEQGNWCTMPYTQEMTNSMCQEKLKIAQMKQFRLEECTKKSKERLTTGTRNSNVCKTNFETSRKTTLKCKRQNILILPGNSSFLKFHFIYVYNHLFAYSYMVSSIPIKYQ